MKKSSPLFVDFLSPCALLHIGFACFSACGTRTFSCVSYGGDIMFRQYLSPTTRRQIIDFTSASLVFSACGTRTFSCVSYGGDIMFRNCSADSTSPCALLHIGFAGLFKAFVVFFNFVDNHFSHFFSNNILSCFRAIL